LPADAVYFGEISLSGAVRPVAQTSSRLKEAQKLGFARAILPEGARAEGTNEPGLSLQSVGSLASLVADIAAQGTRDDRRQPSDDRRRTADDRDARTDPRARQADAG
jgi:DNA repair protein RadA/Sms